MPDGQLLRPESFADRRAYNIALALPIDIHRQIDAVMISLCDFDIRKLQWHFAQLHFGEVKGREWAG